MKDQGIEERPGLVVLRKTQMPAVLAEVGFIDNPSDNAFLDRNFDAIARAIADGILTTLREQKEQTPLYYQVQTGAFRVRMKGHETGGRGCSRQVFLRLLYMMRDYTKSVWEHF